MSEPNNNNSSSEFTWARAFRDIGVKSISSGQFPVFCLFILLAIILWRVPEKDISDLITQFFACQDSSKAGFYIFIFFYSSIGYLIFKFFRHRLDSMVKENEVLRNKLKQISAKEDGK